MKKNNAYRILTAICACVLLFLAGGVQDARAQQVGVKTNALMWAGMTPNIGCEVVVGEHSSVDLSAFGHMDPYGLDSKVFAFQPEFRYWFKPENDGWFVGAHFGAGFYNFALDGDYRYQDHRRETPSMGGGISAGYRAYLSKNKRWKMEFALGGGVYDSHYDKFRNTPDVKDGLLIADYQKVWYGIDQVAVSVAYAFNLKKKGGKK